jgi:hypothetical protein
VFIVRRWRKHSVGYFFCPSCRTRKPCAQCSLTNYLTVFFVPLLPVGTSGECYECEGCGKQFETDSDFPFDFGDHANPKTWTCSHCRSSTPSHKLRCQVCGSDG